MTLREVRDFAVPAQLMFVQQGGRQYGQTMQMILLVSRELSHRNSALRSLHLCMLFSCRSSMNVVVEGNTLMLSNMGLEYVDYELC